MPGLSFLSKCNTHGFGNLPPAAAWDVVGIYSKIQSEQVGNSTSFPDPYSPTSAGQIDSVYGQLDRKIWYKGIQHECYWGDIETSNGVYNWTALDKVINTVRDLYATSGRTSGQNKKVQLLIPTKTFDYAGITKMIPSFRLTTNGFYASPNNTVQRYDQAMGFATNATGYVMRLQDFRLGLSGNDLNGDPIYTIKNAFMAFLTAANNRYKDNPAFGGIITTEPTPNLDADFHDAAEFDRDTYFAGRLQWLKDMKAIFTKHLVAEACNFDTAWVTAMTGSTASDGLAANGIAFINPNYHTGLNLKAIYNAKDFLDGIVPIINSCQGLDQDSKSGQVQRNGLANDIWDWSPTRPGHGNPNTSIENPGYVGSTWTTHDPPDLEWVIERAIYLKSNILVFQHNYAATGKNGAPRFNWADFVAAMDANTTIMSDNTGLNIKLDPMGGMIPTRPLHVAGD